MMKKLAFFLVLTMLVGMFSSCAGIGDDVSKSETTTETPDFELTYEISKREYMRGEAVIVTASVKNISGKDLTYSAVIDSYYPTIELFCQSEDSEVSAKISHEPIDTVSGSAEFTAKAGQVGEKTYTFVIPHDAKLGLYDLTLSYRGETRTFTDVLMIVDKTSQNENSEYEYSPIAVISGGASINPIRTLSSSYVQHADGTFALGCDGMGVWNYFKQDDTDKSTFPLLVYDGSISMDIPEYTDVYSVGIYDLNYERINGYNLTSIDDIKYLLAGDYLIVLSVQYDTSVSNPNEYEKYSYEDFFRIAIPPKNTGMDKKYSYSSVLIESGGFEINPIECMLWFEEHKAGETVTGEGFGVSQIIENKEDHNYFPTLVCKGATSFRPPVNANISSVRIYDTDYNELDYSLDLNELRDLLPGEYLVVFYEKLDSRGCDPEITDYTIRANECIFKFIVPESSIGSFSFAEDSKSYKEGDYGVKTSGFKNTTEQAVSNSNEAAERAKAECTIEYDTVEVLYDSWDKMWSVTFYNRKNMADIQTVYLGEDGITRLMVTFG